MFSKRECYIKGQYSHLRVLTAVEVPLDKVYEEWLASPSLAARHMRDSAYYFNIFSDLYGDAHFDPVLPLRISYRHENGEILVPVCRGNIIKPTEVSIRSAESVTGCTFDLSLTKRLISSLG